MLEEREAADEVTARGSRVELCSRDLALGVREYTLHFFRPRDVSQDEADEFGDAVVLLD